MTVDDDVNVCETRKDVVILRHRDKVAASLIPAIYLLKTVSKKEKQRCHSHNNCSCSVQSK